MCNFHLSSVFPVSHNTENTPCCHFLPCSFMNLLNYQVPVYPWPSLLSLHVNKIETRSLWQTYLERILSKVSTIISFFDTLINSSSSGPNKRKKKQTLVMFQNYNRPFYSCLLSDLAFEWQHGWRWPCFNFCWVNQVVQMLTGFIYMTKAERSVSKQGHVQPHCQSKVRSQSRQLSGTF